MVTNDAIFARLNKIAAVQTNLSEEMRKVELALVDDAKDLYNQMLGYISQSDTLIEEYSDLQRQFNDLRSSIKFLSGKYDKYKDETQNLFTEAEGMVTELGNAADMLGIDPSELEAYDLLTTAMTTFEDKADELSMEIDDELFSLLD